MAVPGNSGARGCASSEMVEKQSNRTVTNFDQLRDKILPVLEPYGVQRIALFGSVVRGEETPESDIDILVDFGARHKVPIGLLSGWSSNKNSQSD